MIEYVNSLLRELACINPQERVLTVARRIVARQTGNLVTIKEPYFLIIGDEPLVSTLILHNRQLSLHRPPEGF